MSSYKKVYLAAPFFTPAQVRLVDMVERIIFRVPRLELYSPRTSGVLKDLPPLERVEKALPTFQRNVEQLLQSDLMVAILNEPDTGTAWEIGGAYFLQRPEYRVIGFYTNQPELNLMLQQCLHAVTHSAGDLEHRLNSYVQGRMK